MIKKISLAASLLLGFFLPESSATATNPYEALPPTKGQTTVIAHCSGCHSVKLLLQNRMSRNGWLKTIRWMQQTQGLWHLEEDILNEILDYLAQHFAPVAVDKLDGLGPRIANPLP